MTTEGPAPKREPLSVREQNVLSESGPDSCR